MEQYLLKDFSKLIKKNAQESRHVLLPLGTDVMRIYNKNLEDLPLTVDLYGAYARIEDYGSSPLSDEDREDVIEAVYRFAYVEKDNILYIYRSKLFSHAQHTVLKYSSVVKKNDSRTENADSSAINGNEEQNSAVLSVQDFQNDINDSNSEDAKKTADFVSSEEEDDVVFSVKENGLLFKVNLSSYTDTGLFLDGAERRSFIREHSNGCDVLNLFSYTGAFSVYAASGGAVKVTSVDLSNTYTEWAKENLILNKFDPEVHPCIQGDAKSFIDNEIVKKSRYDIIIFDPPVFSNSHKMDYTFNVERDYKEWIEKLYKILKKDGFILFCTNLSTFKIDKKAPEGIKITDITDDTRPMGFTKKEKFSSCYLIVKDKDVEDFKWKEKAMSSKSKNFESGNKKRKKEKNYSGDTGYFSNKKSFDKKSYGRSEKTGRSFRGDRDSERKYRDSDYSDRDGYSEKRGRDYDYSGRGERKSEFRGSGSGRYKEGSDRYKDRGREYGSGFSARDRYASERKDRREQNFREGVSHTQHFSHGERVSGYVDSGSRYSDYSDRDGYSGRRGRDYDYSGRGERRSEFRGSGSGRYKEGSDRYKDREREYGSGFSARDRRDFGGIDRRKRDYRDGASFKSDYSSAREYGNESGASFTGKKYPFDGERTFFDKDTSFSERGFKENRDNSFKRDNSSFKEKSKPYGFGSFKKARSRKERDEFFMDNE